MTEPVLAPGGLAAGRFRVEGDASAGAWLARDETTGAAVVLVPIEAAEAAALRPAIGITHPHLAAVLDVLDLGAEGPVLVTEVVSGPVLQGGRTPPLVAVRAALRVADCLSAIHQHGASHAAVGLGALVIEPEGREAPVLTHFPRHRSPSYTSPARRESGGPSEADDTWAVGALMHECLIGEPPPADGLASVEAVAGAGVEDPTLRELLVHTLNADPAKRSRDLRTLKRELARWFVDHAGDDSIPGVPSAPPPPLPASQAPPPAQTSAPPVASRAPSAMPPRKRSKLVPVLAGSAIVFGLLAAWAVSALRPAPVVEVGRQPAAAEPAAPSAVEISEVQMVTPSASVAVGNQQATCVAGWVPPGSLASPAPELGWVCTETDPKAASKKLGAALGGGSGETKELAAKLGWYELAALAVVRAGCCVEERALVLPEPAAGCQAAGPALTQVGTDVQEGKPIEDSLGKLTEAFTCAAKAGQAGAFGRAAPPTEAETKAFRDYVAKVAVH
ncbi:MAG: hypothetical protein IT376_19395 [Polyangiaceae bacterium]|nr:hypothetical protein [Polyangiaceae bacterium]